MEELWKNKRVARRASRRLNFSIDSERIRSNVDIREADNKISDGNGAAAKIESKSGKSLKKVQFSTSMVD